jgi:integrase
MGKSSRPFPTGHFRLNPKRKATSSSTPLVIQIEYTVGGSAVRRSTGYSVRPADWDKTANKGIGGVKASYGVDYRNFNQRLIKIIKTIDDRFEKYTEKHPNQMSWKIAAAIIDQTPETRDDKGIDFIEYVNDLLLNERTRHKIGQSVYHNGLSGMNVFCEFLITEKLGTYAPDKIYVSEISVGIIEKYIAWRRRVKKNTDATINHALTPILKGCKQATLDGYISQSLNNAIQGMRIISKKSLEDDGVSNIKHLSRQEIDRLLNWYANDTEPRRKEYIEMFLFAMHACGLRFVDVLTLKWSNIDFKHKTINKIQVKTKNRNIIPLTDQALAILNQWKEKTGDKRFVFGLLPDDFNLDNSEALYKRRNTVTRSVNQSLEVVGENIKLSFPLSFHVARHTFAVHALNQGVTMTAVSQLLGHTSSEVTEKVYAHYVPATLSKELERIQLPALS